MKPHLSFKGKVFVTSALASSIFLSVANAEYRCDKRETLSHDEQRACEMAKEDSPVHLLQFVRSTAPLYHLRAEDYVSNNDVDHWERSRALALRKASSPMKSDASAGLAKAP